MFKNITPKQLLAILGFIVLVALVLKISEPSGEWVCQEGQWQKHGKTNAAHPSYACAGFNNDVVPPAEASSSDSEELDAQDLITLDSPSPAQVQARKIAISGQARGSWFFEGSFPATITDENGSEIARAAVQARGNWMQDGMVQFEGEISIPDGMEVPPYVMLKLEADDPSGGAAAVPPSLVVPLEIR